MLNKLDDYTYLDTTNIQFLSYKPYSDELTVGLYGGLTTILKNGSKYFKAIVDLIGIDALTVNTSDE